MGGSAHVDRVLTWLLVDESTTKGHIIIFVCKQSQIYTTLHFLQSNIILIAIKNF